MKLELLPFRARLADYEAQADRLLAAWKEGTDRELMNVFVERHPKFLRTDVPWASKRMTEAEIRAVAIDRDDAKLALTRWYEFNDWTALADYAASVVPDDSPITRFETAVEAVINGDAATLQSLLASHPDLVRERSTRVNNCDPPMHRSTLLHYIAANGVEGHRQKTPRNAVEIATILLKAGAEPDARRAYGSECTTMSAGVELPSRQRRSAIGSVDTWSISVPRSNPRPRHVDLAVDDGAGVRLSRDGRNARASRRDGRNRRRSGRVSRADDAQTLLPGASAEDRHRALTSGGAARHVAIVRLLLDVGEDPNRLNPKGNHAHATPWHQAALQGNVEGVRALVEHGARLDIKDTIWDSTPLGWAVDCNQPAVADYLRSIGAP